MLPPFFTLSSARRAVALALLLVLGVAGCRGGLFSAESTPTPPPLVVTPPPPGAAASLAALMAADPPAADLADLNRRLRGVAVPQQVAMPLYAVGDTAAFWYRNEGSRDARSITAVLRYQSDAVSLWFEEGARVSNARLDEAAVVIEETLLPTVRSLFGNDPQPGIDGDPRIYFLHLKEIGGPVVGYFSSADTYPLAVNPYSNQREMLYLSLRQAPLGSDAYYGVIAHELQHLIQSRTDTNEMGWVDEGMAELAAFWTGYNEIDHVAQFGDLTDTQLNDFSYETGTSGHYAASFLFSAYFLERFGVDATRDLIAHPENGRSGFAAALAAQPGAPTFDDFFADWVVANYLAGAGVAQPPYTYDAVALPAPAPSATVRRLPAGGTAGVAQYGTDYLRLAVDGPATLIFTGTQQTRLLDAMPTSGSSYWTTIPADRSDMTLTRAFDLTGVTAATLQFRTWYAIEDGWDYGYVLVSADNGTTWTLLETDSTTRDNPHGGSFGPALTGRSNGWRLESADLTPFAGRPVLVRFEYVTDDAITDQGWAIDDIAVPELGYADDVESGDGGWDAAGWVRHTNVLPQQFIVQLITLNDGAPARVERLALDAANRGRVALADAADVVVAVSGATPVTRQRAAYAYAVSPP